MSLPDKYRLKTILLTSAYFMGCAFITTSSLGKLFPFHVVYRVIYIPFIFWILTALYAYIFWWIEDRTVNISMALMLGIPLHLVLLLLNSFFTVILETPVLDRLYKVYIEAVLFGSVFLSLFWGIAIAKKSIFHRKAHIENRFTSLFFLPVLYIFLYALYLSMKSGNIRILCVLLIITLINFLISSNEKFTFFKFLFRKVKKIVESKWRMVLIIFIFAFLIRLFFGINIVNKTKDAFPTGSDDGTTYDMHGYEIAKDLSYIKNSSFMPTTWDAGYSFFLALIYRIFGRSFYRVVALQSIIGAFVPVLVYLLSEIVIDRRGVAALSAIWCSMDQPLIMLSCILGQEALYIPLVTFGIFILTKYSLEVRNKASFAYDILLGIALGCANVVRSAILYFTPLVVGIILFVKNKRIPKRIVDLFLVLCFISLIIAPITYLNYSNSGKFFLLTKPKPIADWASDTGGGYYFPSNIALARMGVNPFKDITVSMLSIAKKPLKFLSIEIDLIPRRFIGFFFCYNFGFFDPVYMLNAAKLPNRFASNLEFYVAFLVFIGFTSVVIRREWRKKALPMLLLIFYYAMLHVVILRMGSIRYRAPIHPYLFIFGALGIRILFDYIRRGFDYLQ